ncbi:MAG TPA: cupredoxin family copper-binding protein [Candidatus Baltobacteraceae bacterium]|nr:cupredoxin family copper-binding protein [Candidatus Baltobacteraceae bacterium]
MNKILIGILLLALALSPARAANQTVVHMKNDAFIPAQVSISAGDTVLFVNDDDDAHTVTATDNSYDSRGLDSHQSWSHPFTKAGTYHYFCELHPFMKGTVVVSGTPSS